MTVRRFANFTWLIVAVKRIELNREAGFTDRPFGAPPNQAVRDVAQGTMTATEARADPIRQFTAKCVVRVVHADQPQNSGWRVRLGVS